MGPEAQIPREAPPSHTPSVSPHLAPPELITPAALLQPTSPEALCVPRFIPDPYGDSSSSNIYLSPMSRPQQPETRVTAS